MEEFILLMCFLFSVVLYCYMYYLNQNVFLYFKMLFILIKCFIYLFNYINQHLFNQIILFANLFI